MKYISPTTLFKDQLVSIGEAKAMIVLENLISTEKMFRRSLQYINISTLSMIVKVKNSTYSIKYTYNKADGHLIAEKLILAR